MNTSTDSTPGTVGSHPTGAIAPGSRPDDRLWKVLAAVAAVALIGFIVFVVTRPHGSKPEAFPTTPPATLPIGSEAPAFALPRLGGGQPVSLASTRGTPTVVNFFASWCRDCQAELNSFSALSARTAGHLTVIGVDSNDASGTEAETLLAKAGATYPVGVDADARVATNYLLTALPVTYFLDTDGRVVHVAFGRQTLPSLEHWAGVLTRNSPRPVGS